MKSVLTIFAAGLFLSACGSEETVFSGPPTGGNGRAVRGICDAASLILLHEGRLSCASGYPGNPYKPDERFFGEQKPCRVTKTRTSDGVTEVVDFDASTPWADEFATYNEDGNLISWNAVLNFGRDQFFYFDYEDGLLVSAYTTVDGVEKRYGYENDGGRRVREYSLSTSAEYFYVYDGDKLIAEGPPVAGKAPERYEESFLTATGAGGELPLVPLNQATNEDSFHHATAPHMTYYYDGDRLSAAGRAGAPGLQFGKFTYGYEGELLKTVTTTGMTDQADFYFQPQTWTYDYQCE